MIDEINIRTDDGEKVLKLKIPIEVVTKKKPEQIRRIKLVDKIDKGFWYDVLAGTMIDVYLFPNYANALSVTFKDQPFISWEHFELVRYTGGRNDDIRLK